MDAIISRSPTAPAKEDQKLQIYPNQILGQLKDRYRGLTIIPASVPYNIGYTKKITSITNSISIILEGTAS